MSHVPGYLHCRGKARYTSAKAAFRKGELVHFSRPPFLYPRYGSSDYKAIELNPEKPEAETEFNRGRCGLSFLTLEAASDRINLCSDAKPSPILYPPPVLMQ